MRKSIVLVLVLISLAFVALTNKSEGFSLSLKDTNDVGATNEILVKRNVSELVNDSDNWTITKSIAKTNIKEEIVSSSFIDETTWWVATNEFLYATKDKGTTVIKKKIPLLDKKQVVEIKFFNIQVGWLLIQKPLSDSVLNADNNYYKLFRTIDGGETWDEQLSDKGVFVSKLTFNDSDNGWIIGNEFVGISPVRFMPYILKTTDGGKKWENLSNKIGEKLKRDDHVKGILLNQNNGVNFITSSNKLIKFSKDKSVIEATISFKNMPVRNQFFEFGNKGNWMAGNINAHGTKVATLATSNADNSWNINLLNMAFFSHISEVSTNSFVAHGYLQKIPDENDTSVVNEVDTVIKSDDNGKHWSVIFNAKHQKIKSIYPVDSQNILILLEKGEVINIKKN